jgi:hypothetical protein
VETPPARALRKSVLCRKYCCPGFAAGGIIPHWKSEVLFMAITLKRQLTPDEKNIILQRHGRICFATGHAIPEQESIH